MTYRIMDASGHLVCLTNHPADVAAHPGCHVETTDGVAITHFSIVDSTTGEPLAWRTDMRAAHWIADELNRYEPGRYKVK